MLINTLINNSYVRNVQMSVTHVEMKLPVIHARMCYAYHVPTAMISAIISSAK